MENTYITDQAVQDAFLDAGDFVRRTMELGSRTLYAYFIDGITSGEEIAAWVLRPIMRSSPRVGDLYGWALNGGVYAATAEEAGDLETLVQKLLNGYCGILFPDGRALVFEAKTGEKRSVSDPTVETTVKGARDAFTETIRTNTSLVRRHLRTSQLAFRHFKVGRRSGTGVAVAWLKDLTDPALVRQVLERLEAIDIEALLSPAAVEQYITGSRTTAFPLLLYTQRTDKFSRGLLEGRVGILVDGLPLGYLTPATLSRFMVSPEDRGGGFIIGAGLRGLRYLALVLSLLLPGLYLAMTCFHQEMIPTTLLLAIIDSRQSVPFSAVTEVLALLIAFELLQEAGLHLPQSVGQSLSIIGGLVVGTAAVEAKLISPAALIVAATAGICAFTLPEPDLTDAVRVWRLLLTVAAALSGLFGLTVAALALLIHLAGLETLGVPYLDPFAKGHANGRILPVRLAADKLRDPALNPQDLRKQR